MSNQPTRAPRKIKVRRCNDRCYETIEVVTELNESQSAVTALTRTEAFNLIARLAEYLSVSDATK